MIDRYKVYQLMTHNPVIMGSGKTVKEAALAMKEKGTGSVLVVDGDSLKGLLTEKDVMYKVTAFDKKPSEVLVDDIMTLEKEVVSIESTKSIYDAMVLMNNDSVRRLPVVDNGVLKGIITAKDILKVEPELFDTVVDNYRLREEDRKKEFF